MANVPTVCVRAEEVWDSAAADTDAPLARVGRAVWTAITAASLAFLLLDWMFPFPFARLEPDTARAVPSRNDVSPMLARTVVAYEDRWFGWHPGVNPASIARAAMTNWESGRVVTGASTIPMQLARLVEPAPHTWWEKCREAFRAMQLQRHLSSNQLLALYLNHSKYGRPVEGIAARRVFPQRAMAAAERSTWVDRGRSTRSDRALAATNPG